VSFGEEYNAGGKKTKGTERRIFGRNKKRESSASHWGLTECGGQAREKPQGRKTPEKLNLNP